MTNVQKLPGKWWPFSIAPDNVDLEVCVVDRDGVHALVFPVHRSENTGVDASTRKLIDIVRREWNEHRQY